MTPTQLNPPGPDALDIAPPGAGAVAAASPSIDASAMPTDPAAGGRGCGAADAPTTLVVYGNYSCLHCRRAYAALDDLASDLGDALRIEYRHFARPEDFPEAERAAEAASAAAAQGRFWEMHRRLAGGRPFFDQRALIAQAADLGLDVDRFASELRAGPYRDRVRAEHAAGVAAGVVATPSFFLNGAEFAERWDLDALGAAVLRAVARAAVARVAVA